jgi:hypothetical protein
MSIAKKQLIYRILEVYPKSDKARVEKLLNKKSIKFVQKVYEIFYDMEEELKKAVASLCIN